MTLRLVLARLERDRPSIVPCDVFSLREFFRAIFSPHVLILAVVFFMVGTIEFGLAMSFPSIIDGLGATGIKAQLLGVGPFITGFFSACLGRTRPQDHVLMVPFESSNNKIGGNIGQ